MGAHKRFLNVVIVIRRWAFIEHHDDIRAQVLLEVGEGRFDRGLAVDPETGQRHGAERRVLVSQLELDGEIVDVNTSLPDKLETLNVDPYGDGWIIKIKISNQDDLGELIDAAAYKELI